MSTKDITVDGNLTDVTVVTDSMRFMIIDAGTLKDVTASVLATYINPGTGNALQFRNESAFTPTDATTYYLDGVGHRTTDANARIYVPRTGTITKVFIRFLHGGPGSSETSTVSLRLNSSTDTTISSSVVNDANNTVFSNTGLSIAVTQGDYISIKWVTPTWATNPTSTTIDGVVFVE